MERDNFECRECGDADKTLHVHHLYYLKGLEPWGYSRQALITLCERCHALVEGEMDGIKRSVGMILASSSLGILTGAELITAIANYAHASSCAGEVYGDVRSFLLQCANHEIYMDGKRSGKTHVMHDLHKLGMEDDYNRGMAELEKAKVTP